MTSLNIGDVFRTTTVILGGDWDDPSAPTGLLVKVVRVLEEGPEVEALESRGKMTAGSVFFCPPGNLGPAD